MWLVNKSAWRNITQYTIAHDLQTVSPSTILEHIKLVTHWDQTTSAAETTNAQCAERQQTWLLTSATETGDTVKTTLPCYTAATTCSALSNVNKWQIYISINHQRIDYKLAVLTYKVRSTGTPSYFSHHSKPRISTRHLRSSSHLLLQKPTTRTHFADRAFRCTAPTVWNSLNSCTVDNGSLAVFKSRLETFLFRRTFNPV